MNGVKFFKVLKLFKFGAFSKARKRAAVGKVGGINLLMDFYGDTISLFFEKKFSERRRTKFLSMDMYGKLLRLICIHFVSQKRQRHSKG